MAGSGNSPDIKLLFGVSGNGEISSGSGKLIKDQLDNIVSKINQNPLQINMQISQQSLNAMKSQIEAIRSAAANASGSGAGSGSGSGDETDRIRALTQVSNLYTQILRLQTQIHAAGADNYGGVGHLGKTLEDVKALREQLMRSDSVPDDFSRQFDILKLAISDARHSFAEFSKSRKESLGSTYDLKAFNSAMQQLGRETKTVAGYIEQFRDAGTTGNAVQKNAYSSLYQYSTQLERLKKDLESGKLSEAEFRKELGRIRSEADKAAQALRPLQQQIEETAATVGGAEVPSYMSQVGTSLSNQFSRITSTLSARLLGYNGMMMGIRAVKDMMKDAIDLEEQFAEYRIVTQRTEQEASIFADNIAKTAQDVSTSIEDLVSATITYSRLGYDANDAGVLARLTGMLERVGDIDTQPAEDAVTSILKAFSDEIDVSNAESVMDRLVAVGNGFPISVEQIAAGMTNASSALAAAGNRFDESVALLTAANTTIQNASKSSTGLRTIAARLRNTKAALDELGEVQTEAKYEELVQMLTKYQVSLTDLNGEYRSTYDIMKDIAGMWGQLTSMEQAAMATEIAGVRQQAVFYSLIEQFGEAENAMKVMENSTGSLSDAYAIYEETTSAHLATLGAAWEDLSRNIVDNGALNGIIDFATGVVNLANNLAKVNALLPTLLGMITAFKALQIGAAVIKIQTRLGMMVPSLIATTAATEAQKQSVQKLNIAEQARLATMIQTSMASKGANKETINLTLSNLGLAAAEETTTTATGALSAAFKSLLLSNPIGMIAAVVAGLVSLGVALYNASDSYEDIAEKNKEINNDISEINTNISQAVSNFKQIKQSADEAIPRFVELAEGVNKFGKNISLTDEEYEEYISLSNKMAELFPEIDAGMDSNGNHILSLDQSASNLTETLYGLLEAQRAVATQEIASNKDRLFADREDIVSGYEEEIRLAELHIAQREKWLQSARGRLSDAEFRFSTAKYMLNISEPGKERAEAVREYEQAQREYEAARADVEKWDSELKQAEAYRDSLWGDRRRALVQVNQDLARSYTAWLQTQDDFANATETAQNTAISMLSNVSWSDFDSSGEAEDWIRRNIIEPVLNMEPEVQSAIEDVANAFSGFKSGAASVKAVQSAIDEANKAASKYGTDLGGVYDSIGVDATKLLYMTNVISVNLKDDKKDVDEFINSLSYDELERVFSLITEDGVTSIEDLKEALYSVAKASTEAFEETDFKTFFEDLEKSVKNIEKVVEAMNKLKEGTALSKSELVKLAMQFPEMLDKANAFTDGSIAGQQKLLQFVLDCYEKDYDAKIEVEIAKYRVELDGIQKRLQAQFEALKITRAQYEEYMSGVVSFWDEQNPTGDLTTYIEKYHYLTVIQNSERRMQELQNKIDNLSALKGLTLEDVYAPSASKSSSSSSSSKSSSDTWIKKQYEEHKHYVEMDRETNAQFLKWLSDAYKRAYNEGIITQSEYYKYEEEVYKGVQKLAEQAKSAMEDLIQYRIKMLKEQNTKEKDDLKDRLDAIKDFYSKQKELLQEQYDEEKYLEDQAEKRNNVSSIMAQLAQISRDNSAYGEKRRLELEEELAAAQKELNDFEREHSLDTVLSDLDRMEEQQTAAIQAQVDAIEEVVNDPTALYNIALNDIKNNTAELKQAFLDYNRTHGDGTDTAVEKMWNDAVEALSEYRAYYGTNYGGFYLGGYASGTTNATRGIHSVNEYGSEMLFKAADGRSYRLFSGGEMVLPADASRFLYDFAMARGGFGGASAIRGSGNGAGVVVNTGNIIINGSADECTVSQIRRAQRENVDMILRELNKFSK